MLFCPLHLQSYELSSGRHLGNIVQRHIVSALAPRPRWTPHPRVVELLKGALTSPRNSEPTLVYGPGQARPNLPELKNRGLRGGGGGMSLGIKSDKIGWNLRGGGAVLMAERASGA